MYGMDLSDFSLILQSVIKAGYFRFDSSFYRQRDGLGMGVKPAPSYAIIYVYCVIELPLLHNDYTYAPNAPPRPADLPQIDLWGRYVDDCLSIIEGDDTTISYLFDYINSLDSNIQFTFECSKTVIAFLDMNIHLNPDFKCLDFSLFIKPTSQGIFLNYHSAHPKSVILNAAKNEIRRACNNSSTPELQLTSITHIKEMLHKNDYPDKVINKLVQEIMLSFMNSTTIIDEPQITKTTYLSLPYINEQTCRKVFYTLRKNKLLQNTRVTFTSGKRLVDTLT